MQGAEFEQVYDFGNLYAGFLKARRGKRHKPSVAKFEANLLEALCLLSEMLKTKTYRPSDYFVFKVYEPKERIVMTNAFKDKVVQHSLCDNILEPAFSKAFIRDNYASQSGRGTHDGLYRLEEFMRSYYFTRKANAERERRAAGLPPPGPEEVRHYSDGWVLKCDISKYFYSIQHEPLKQMTRKYIKDPDILWLVDLIVDSTENPGIPIGNQTSQWFAVMYLSGMDHFIKEKLGIRYYITYDTAGGAQDGAGSTTKPSGTTTPPATLAFAVGDVVRFTGNTHYTNAAAASGAACKPGTAKVTALAKDAKHPYHLIKQPGGGSTVYGWVNAADVQAVGSGTTAPKMRVGAKVKYSGPLYRDSNGGGKGKTVNGTYTVKYYYTGRKCGVHIDGLGWVPESGCTVIG